MSDDRLVRLLISVLSRAVEAERRIAGVEYRGRVKEVDGAKHAVRVVIGTDPDGEEVLSPWVKVAQTAGKMKFHDLPSVGQQVSLQSVSGDIEQARVVPLHWSEGFEALSDDPDVKIMELGSVKVSWSESEISVMVGGSGIQITEGGVFVVGPSHTHNGVNVGDTHVHGGVVPGNADTNVPH